MSETGTHVATHGDEDDVEQDPSPGVPPIDTTPPARQGDTPHTKTKPNSSQVGYVPPDVAHFFAGDIVPPTQAEIEAKQRAIEKRNANLKPFVKGDPRMRDIGRMAAQARETNRLKRLARDHCEDAINVLVTLMHRSRSDKVRKEAATEILDRGLGKPKQVDYSAEVDEDTGVDLKDVVIEMVMDKFGNFKVSEDVVETTSDVSDGEKK